MKRPRFVVFDFDGVLADTVYPWYEVVVEELRACGVDISLEDAVSSHRGRLLHDMLVDIERDHSVRFSTDWTDRVVARGLDAVGRACRPIPGSVATVRSLGARGLPLAVASGNLRSVIANGIETIGLAELLAERIVSSHDDGRHKPLPDVYLRACRLLMMDPSSGLAVDDSEGGVISAKAAGMTVVGLAIDSDPTPLLKAGASVVLERMDDLTDLFR